MLARLCFIGRKGASLAHPLVNVWREADGDVVHEADSGAVSAYLA